MKKKNTAIKSTWIPGNYDLMSIDSIKNQLRRKHINLVNHRRLSIKVFKGFLMKILHPLVPNVTFLHLLIILENHQKTNGNKWVKNMFPITLETTV